MPLPLHDITKAGRVEDSVQRIQLYLCRNHSDERLKVELAARHRHRLLTATQQSVSYHAVITLTTLTIVRLAIILTLYYASLL